MTTVKISQLPTLNTLEANTANTFLIADDFTTGVTSKITLTTLAGQLYSNNALAVGNNLILFPDTIAQFSGNAASYLQVNQQNFNPFGSSDYILTGDIGTNTQGYIDLGINNSQYNTVAANQTAQSPMDGYLVTQGDGSYFSNLIIGTSTTGANVIFTVGGQNANNIIAKITSTGVVMNTAMALIFGDGTSQTTAGASNAYAQAAFATANSALQNSANILIPGNLILNGVTTFNGNTVFESNTVHYGALTTNGNNITNGVSTLNGNVNISGTTVHTGNTYFIGGVTANGISVLNGPLTVNGNTTVTGSTSVIGNTNVTGNTVVTGNTTVTGSTLVTGNTTVTGNTFVTGAITISGNTVANGTSTLNGNVTVVGVLVNNGTSINNGNTTLNGLVTTTSTLTIGGTLIPANNNISLGTPSNPFNTLYTSNSSVVFANANVSISGTFMANGQSDFLGPVIIQNQVYNQNVGSLEIIGSNNYSTVIPASNGVMMHVTGLDYIASKIMNDSFGPGNTYSVFVGRAGRGSAGAPTASQAGDTIARFSGSSYSSPNSTFITTGVGRMDIVALENNTDSSRGAMIAFSAVPVGSNTIATNLVTIASNVMNIGSNTSLNVANAIYVAGNVVPSQVIGTWTPSMLFATTQGTQVYATQYGNYIKTGRKVYATFDIVITSLGTGAGNFSMSLAGLPTPMTGNGTFGALEINTQQVTASDPTSMQGTVASGATSVPVFGQIIVPGGGGSITYRQITAADLGGTTNITGTIQYISAA